MGGFVRKCFGQHSEEGHGIRPRYQIPGTRGGEDNENTLLFQKRKRGEWEMAEQRRTRETKYQRNARKKARACWDKFTPRVERVGGEKTRRVVSYTIFLMVEKKGAGKSPLKICAGF